MMQGPWSTLHFMKDLTGVLQEAEAEISVVCYYLCVAGSDGKESACNGGDLGSIPGSEDPLEQEMATVATFLELLLCISLLSPDEEEQIEGR